jgi:hypothetical protein
MSSAFGSTFATTVRVIYRIHCRTSNMRASSQPTTTSSLADFNVHVVVVTNTPNNRTAFYRHTSNFTARHVQLRPTGIRITGNQCRL